MASEHFALFFTLSIEPMCVVGADGSFQRVNEVFTRRLGWEESEIVGRPAVDFLHPEDQEDALANLRDILNGLPIPDLEYRHRCKNGSYRIFFWPASSLVHVDGLVYAAGRDVTWERTEAEEHESAQRELNTARKQLKSLERLLTRCSGCRKVRNEVGNWDTVEHYIARRMQKSFVPEVCPECRQHAGRAS
jgi:PAS domain S-box-containing protein